MTGGGGDRRSPPRGGDGESLFVEAARRGLLCSEDAEGAGSLLGFHKGAGIVAVDAGGFSPGVPLGPAYGALGSDRAGPEGAAGRGGLPAAAAVLPGTEHGCDDDGRGVVESMDTGVDLHGTVHEGCGMSSETFLQDGFPQTGVAVGDGRGDLSHEMLDATMEVEPARRELPPLSGRFVMGDVRPNVNSSFACTSGVRLNASAWNQSWKDSNLNPGTAGSPRAAWGRPAVVQLPSPAELGEVRGGPDRVILDTEEVNITLQKFETALVGRLFGKRIPFAYLNKELQRRWQGFGPFRLVTVGADSFICFFNSVEGRNAVLMGGPWVVAGQVIGVDRWSPDFSPASKAGFITPIWVRFAELPLYCWSGRSLARIAVKLGEPIWMDASTDRLERGQFARVCIRMDLAQALRPGIWVDGPFGSFYQKIIYEGLPSFCFRCGHVGHKAPQCTTVGEAATVVDKARCEVVQEMSREPCSEVQQGSQPAVVDVPTEKEGHKLAHVGEVIAESTNLDCPGLGPWMVVQRRKNLNKGPKGGAQLGIGIQVRGSAGGEAGKVSKGLAKTGKLGPGPGGSRPTWAPNIKAMNGIVETELGSSSLSLSEVPNGKGLEGGVFSGFKALPSSAKEGPSLVLAVHGAGGTERASYRSRDKKRKHVIHHDGGVASSLVRQ